ncbi:MAG: hypothetical protein KF729_00020 [Sandaracinaceae bacterium]|nr:hypothetical protein [Sandaracinaceae bacterium]
MRQEVAWVGAALEEACLLEQEVSRDPSHGELLGAFQWPALANDFTVNTTVAHSGAARVSCRALTELTHRLFAIPCVRFSWLRFASDALTGGLAIGSAGYHASPLATLIVQGWLEGAMVAWYQLGCRNETSRDELVLCAKMLLELIRSDLEPKCFDEAILRVERALLHLCAFAIYQPARSARLEPSEREELRRWLDGRGTIERQIPTFEIVASSFERTIAERILAELDPHAPDPPFEGDTRGPDS